MELKRKAYQELIEWKNKKNHKPLIIEGLRQVGKSYLANKFAYDNYENVVVFDFRHQESLRKAFEGDLSVDNIIENASVYLKQAKFIPYKTVIIFEEISDCPLARTSLKSFYLDGRYDIIATGSLLGVVNYRRNNLAKVPTGYEEILTMKSLDFEEFLWANKVEEKTINILKEHTINIQELSGALSKFFSGMLKKYMIIGGLPEVITSYLENENNIMIARAKQETILKEYRSDFGRYIDENGNEYIDGLLQLKLNQLFDSIIKQLAKERNSNEVTKFVFSEIRKYGRYSEYANAFDWLKKAGLILICNNVRTIESPLSMNVDDNYFKVFFTDPGLLMASLPISSTQYLLNNDLDSKKGYIYENLAAVFLDKANFPLYYFSNGKDHLEVDFLIEGKDGIILVEEKSTNGRMAASKNIMSGLTKYKASQCIKIIDSNFGIGSFYTSIPQYASPFLFEIIKKEIEDNIKSLI